MTAGTVDSRLSVDEMARLIGPAEIARLYRERVVRDKSYQDFPMGQEVAAFLSSKRKRYAANTLDAYESTLDKLARAFPYLELKDFEPPVGANRLEEWMDQEWGGCKPATYNRHLAAVREFFRWHLRRGNMLADPTTLIDPAKKRQAHRTTFTPDQRRAIIAAADELRDRIALRLLLTYGLRRGGLQDIQFKHFDHVRKRLAVFLKGGKVRSVPIPEPEFWHDLERHILDVGAKPTHFLMASARRNRHGATLRPDQPMSGSGLHKWWYRRLAAAGVVEPGPTAGEKMHKARHTAGQAILDQTGNLKATQALLGHASIATTADTYVDWDIDRLTETLERVLRQEDV
jgi:site-specific recombinase XerD